MALDPGMIAPCTVLFTWPPAAAATTVFLDFPLSFSKLNYSSVLLFVSSSLCVFFYAGMFNVKHTFNGHFGGFVGWQMPSVYLSNCTNANSLNSLINFWGTLKTSISESQNTVSATVVFINQA